jgi:hypothetical protein
MKSRVSPTTGRVFFTDECADTGEVVAIAIKEGRRAAWGGVLMGLIVTSPVWGYLLLAWFA